jgi:glycosyltransferase involved in cell wall biosynthesis
MKKKIAYIINHLSFFYSHLMPHALKARNAGYEIKVFCGEPLSLDSEKFAKKKIFEKKISYINCKFSSISLNFFKDLPACIKIYKELKKFNPNIVHLTTPKAQILGGLISRIIGVESIIIFISGMGYLFSNKLNLLEKIYKKIFFIIQNIIFKHKKLKIIVENKYDYKYFIDSFSLNKNKIIIIKGSGVNLKKFKRVNHIKNKIILLPARVILEKGIIEFVQAANLLKKYKYNFLVAGSLDYSKPSSFKKFHLEELNANKSVEFIGYKKNIYNILKKTSIVCLPSYREGLPKSLCEASACGIPIVATNTIGCTEVVKQGFNGELCIVKDHISLKKKIEKLILSPKIRKIYGNNSYFFARKNFDIELIGNKIIDIYNNF